MDIETKQPSVSSPDNGMITKLLLAENIISPQQLAYAVRVRSKLATPKTMIDSLLDLGYLTREILQETLRNNRVKIRLGDFLVELGYLREADLKQALGIQGETINKQRLGEILISRGFIEERKLLEALSYQLVPCNI
jgi:type IV pilus assembly protein PilB